MSLRTYLSLFLASIAALLAVTFMANKAYEAQLIALKEVNDTNDATHQLIRQLAASSEDLTRLARSYVATDNPIFIVEFDLILKAREGEETMELSSVKQQFLWGETDDIVRTREPLSLRERLLAQGVLQTEMIHFDRALSLSNGLGEIEAKAIALSSIDKQVALNLLFNEDYYATKEAIFNHINRFSQLIDLRITADRGEITTKLQRLKYLNVLLAMLLVVAIALLVRFLYSSIVSPLKRLTEHAKQFTPYQQRSGLELDSNVSEIVSLNNTINSMQQSIRQNVIEMHEQITELERTKLQAEVASDSKAQFLANMSHEIRTPLNGVSGLCYLLKDTNPTPTQQNYINLAIRSTDALMQVINDILDWSKLDADQVKVDNRDVDLANKIDFVIGLTCLSVQDKDVEFELEMDESVPQYYTTDPARLRQVLLNLISNAVKFTDQGSIHLRVFTEQQQLVFEVKDTGIGMTKEQCQRVFDPFEQADSTTTRHYGGTGLGLAISNKFVELLGGTLNLHSTLNKGTTVQIRLPLDSNDAPHFSELNYPAPAPRVALNFGSESKLRHGQRLLRDLSVPYHLGLSSEVEPALIMIDSLSAKHNAERLKDCAKPILYFGAAQEFERHCRTLNWSNAQLLFWPLTKVKLSEAIQQAVQATVAATEMAVQPTQPLTKAKKHTDTPKPSADTLTSSSITVLVADDVPMNQLVIERILKKAGVNTLLADNGQQALDILEQQSVDLVLMDLHMPVMDGYQTAQAIRESAQYSSIPIVALTADVQPEARQKCAELGIDKFILKPYSPDEIKQTLKDLTNYSQS